MNNGLFLGMLMNLGFIIVTILCGIFLGGYGFNELKSISIWASWGFASLLWGTIFCADIGAVSQICHLVNLDKENKK